MRVFYKVRFCFIDRDKYNDVDMWVQGRKLLYHCLQLAMQHNNDITDIHISYQTYLPENLWEVMPSIWIKKGDL